MAVESALKKPNIGKALYQQYRLIRAKAIDHHNIPRPSQPIALADGGWSRNNSRTTCQYH
jgi:hypothetical protein